MSWQWLHAENTLIRLLAAVSHRRNKHTEHRKEANCWHAVCSLINQLDNTACCYITAVRFTLYAHAHDILLFGRSCNSCRSGCSGGELGQHLRGWYGKKTCWCPHFIQCDRVLLFFFFTYFTCSRSKLVKHRRLVSGPQLQTVTHMCSVQLDVLIRLADKQLTHYDIRTLGQLISLWNCCGLVRFRHDKTHYLEHWKWEWAGFVVSKGIVEEIQQERMVKVRTQHHVSDRMPVR